MKKTVAQRKKIKRCRRDSGAEGGAQLRRKKKTSQREQGNKTLENTEPQGDGAGRVIKEGSASYVEKKSQR